MQEPPRVLGAIRHLQAKVQSRGQGPSCTVSISSVHLDLQLPSFSHLLHLLQVSEPLLKECYGRCVDDGRGDIAAVPSHWRG